MAHERAVLSVQGWEMSFVIAAPDALVAAGSDIAGIGSAIKGWQRGRSGVSGAQPHL
jgi:hypothetical protein